MTINTSQGRFPPPPGLLSSIMAGFDSVATHIALILPPVLLDLFLWLGPRLQLKQFLQPVIAQLPSLANAFPSSFPDPATIQAAWISIANHFNLFVILRTFPVGITSLLNFVMPGQNPLGAPVSMDAGSFVGILGWALMLVFLGWIAGGMYYYWVSRVALKSDVHALGKSLGQAVLLSIIWLGLLFLIGLPVLLVLTVLTAVSTVLGQIILFGGAIMLIWLAMPVFFSAHGIFTFQLDALRAILSSLRMVRFTLPNTGLFLLIFLLINQGLNFLWTTPAQTSWFMLVGITGHAFISTALLASSFIYYRDINTWLKAVFEQLQRQANSVKV